MNRRGFLLTFSGMASLAALPGAAFAGYADTVAAQLTREGFAIRTTERTWLGRVRIEAVRGAVTREVVVDPASGEILRDYREIGDARSANPGKGSGDANAASRAKAVSRVDAEPGDADVGGRPSTGRPTEHPPEEPRSGGKRPGRPNQMSRNRARQTEAPGQGDGGSRPSARGRTGGQHVRS